MTQCITIGMTVWQRSGSWMKKKSKFVTLYWPLIFGFYGNLK